jgi:hypothetical protein
VGNRIDWFLLMAVRASCEDEVALEFEDDGSG